MNLTLRRKSIEGAISIGMVPKVIQPSVQAILDSVPDIDSLEINLKAFDKDGKEADIGVGIKMKLLALMLSNVKESK